MCAAASLRGVGSVASCSGRHLGLPNFSSNVCPSAQFRKIVRRQCTLVLALYNFADASEERIPGQRRNRGEQKREARGVLEVVRGLTRMSPKQLAAVEHLLPPGTPAAVGIAAKLPRSNQGRKRQEALVAKMLRGQLTEHQLDKLGEAVSLVADNSGVYDDGDVSGLVAAWREGLLEDDQEIVTEVYGYPTSWAPDHQQLRALVRQCQQALSEERGSAQDSTSRQQVTSALGANGSGSSIGEEEAQGEDGEDLAAVLAEAAEAARAGGRRRRGAAEPRRSRALLRSLAKMLRPLAVRVLQG